MQKIKHRQSDHARAQLAMAAVALEFGVAEARIRRTRGGSPRCQFARQIAMYLTHIVYELNVSRVARAFSRDRSTVSHACRVVEESREDQMLDEQLTALERFLMTAPAPRGEG